MRIHHIVFVLALIGMVFATSLTSLKVDILQPEGDVAVYNGSSFNVSLNVSCPAAGCGGVNVTLMAASAPKSCRQILDDNPSAPDGTYLICPSGTSCVNVYCDMENGGWASIFQMEGDLTLDGRDCIMHNFNDDMDSVILWTDLSTKVRNDNGETTNGQNWFTWQRDGTQDMGLGYLSDRPDGISDYSNPVPLPASNKTIWFDWNNQQIAWDDVKVPFSDVGMTTDSGCGGGDYPYFISDGVNMIHVAHPGDSSARLLTFDFLDNSVSGVAAVTFNPQNDWWQTEQDSFGHVLYTVNGRVMYFDKMSSDESQGYFALGGGLDNPNSMYDTYNVTAWSNPWQPGLDFFARVDEDNHLWFGDWGHDNGGYFNCGDDEYLGVGHTNIMLTYADTGSLDAEPIPASGTPFHTSQNPRPITLSSGESAIVNYTVFSTKPGEYLLFAEANQTGAPYASNTSDVWSVHTYGRVNPTPHQLAPADGAYFAPSSVSMNFSCGGGIIDTIQLWSNTGGSWSRDYTDSSYDEGDMISLPIPSLEVGVYKWAVWCNTTIGGKAWSSNRTMHISDSGLFECTDIDEPGTYTLAANISAPSGRNCFNVNADNVKIDCAGHSIIGNMCSGDYSGVYSDSSNTQVVNCDIRNFDEGVYLGEGSEYGLIQHNNISNTGTGVDLEYTQGNSVLNNVLNSNEYGFYLYYADNNEIGHNLVNATEYSNFGEGSCPFLYLWNGSSYGYYTDLAGEPLGVPWFKPQKYQSGMYELGDFRPVDGLYKLKMREVIPESDFVDKIRLALVDVPEGYSALSKWSNTYPFNQAPDNGFMTIRDPIRPVSAIDSYGNDVLAQVSDKDGVPVKIYNDTQNPIILDFGHIENPQYAKLILTGWGTYDTYNLPTQNYLVVETMGSDGNWTVRKKLGSFIGDSRTIIYDISGILTQDDTRMRITPKSSSSSINVVDSAMLDDSAPVPFNVTYLDPSKADLRWGGSTGYEYATTEHRHINIGDEHLPNVDNFVMYGNFTKYGDVKALMNEADDEFAIMRHGDEISLEYIDIPRVEGSDRYAFLDADVMYTIRYSINGFVRDTIDPMPFHGMSSYPYGSGESYPTDPAHQAYRTEWNTREYVPFNRTGGSLPYSFNNTVFQNSIFGGDYGLYLDHEDSTRILNNYISDVETGIEVYRSTNTTVKGNTIFSVGGVGVYIYDDTEEESISADEGHMGSQLMNNNIHSNNSEDCYFEGDCAAVYLDRTYDNVLQGNSLFAIDADGISLRDSYNNDFTSNRVTTSGEDYFAAHLWQSSDNTFLHNTFRSDYWVDDEGGTTALDGGWNYYNDETSGNKYYFADGTGAWTGFNITDTNGDGWADEGSDLPFSCETVGDCGLEYHYWIGYGEDNHPFVGTDEPSAHNEGNGQALSVGFQSNCSGNYVSVTSGGEPVSGAYVSVFDASNLGDLGSGTTDENGVLSFDGCGHTMKAHATMDGYKSGDGSSDMVSCGQCAQPECQADSDCPDTKMCSEQKCVAVECSCGSVSQHQCTAFACCSNSDCKQGETCQEHSCKKTEACVAPSCCTADSMCADNQNCVSPTGAQVSASSPGKCNDISGQCGTVKNHAFVAYGYECGTEQGCPSCPQGSVCTDHKCVSNDLKGPQTGFVGDNAKVQATEGDGVCKDCDIQGVDPTGKNFTGKTGPDGSFSLPLTLQGTYKVSLLKDGAIVKTIQINSLPKAPAEEPVKPTATGGTEIFSLIGLLVLLLVVILGVVYWRSTIKK